MIPKEASRNEPQEFDHARDCPRNRDCDETPVSGECLSHELEGCPKCECSVSALDAARAERDARFTEAEVRELVREAFTQGYELGGCDSEGHRIYRLEPVRDYFLDDASIGFASYIARIRASRGPR